MVINPMKALLFAGGAAAAIAATAWLAGSFDPYLASKPPVVAAVPDPGAPVADRKEGLEPPALPADAAAEVIPPSFDLLRAEADGSIVIAGRAAPNSLVEIIAGSEVVGSTKAGPEGDFAAVLDNPLKPGDHQIVLRSTTADNIAAASPETAIVSIPEQPDGQVLALVEQPGEPSKLITVPEATEAAAADPQPEPAPAEVAAAASGDAPAGPAMEAHGEPTVSPLPQGESQLAATTEQPITEPQAEAASQPVAPAAEVAAANPVEPKPAPARMAAVAPDAAPAAAPQPAEQVRVAVEAVEIEGEQVFVAGFAEPGKVVRVYANDILLGDATVSPGGRFLVETVRELPVGDYIVRADLLDANGAEVLARAAVPFEREAGESIAAVAPALAPAVSVAPVTEPAQAAPSADAAAETEQDPQPTAPTVAEAAPEQPAEPTQETAAAEPAADAADAPVPEQQAAIAPPPAAQDAQPSAPAVADAAPQRPAKSAEPSVDAAEQQAMATPQPDAGSPQVAPPAGADDRPATQQQVAAAPRPAAQLRQSAAPADEVAAEQDPAPSAAPQPSTGAEAPSEPGEQAPSTVAGSAPAAPAPLVADAAPPPAETEPVSPAETADGVPAGEEQQVAAASPPTPADLSEPPTVTAPKLTSVPSAVIIRRGDNLWRISSRVYGHGLRYTTIYLANQSQIRDPDLIFPGQVFSVPKRTEEGIPADMEAIRERFAGSRRNTATR